MAENDDFEPRLGRMRSGGGKGARRYLGRVLAAANLAAGGGARGARPRAFSGHKLARAAGTGRLLAAKAPGTRRVIVKTSIVKLAGKGASAAAAHLRYLQRDGTTREGEAGSLYGPDGDGVDVREFHSRCAGDRHQFRFIVSAEDGDQYDDLQPLTRRLMERVEEDLGTRLDWVAVDHFNTGHPHTHIVVRGRDDRGRDLVIAKDYIAAGLRARATELVELDLGPPTERETGARRQREIGAERLTSIDRTLVREGGPVGVVAAAHADRAEHSLRAGRLAKLHRMGLAESLGGGQYRLDKGLEDTLRTMGERSDIVRTMQRAVAERALNRAVAEQAIFDSAGPDGQRLVGRVVMRGLADEARDRHYLIVDGADGRAHYVDIGTGRATGPIAEDSIVAISARRPTIRAADRTIAAVAGGRAGSYDIAAHLAADPSASEDFAATHVRRLEAARRAGVGVERSSSGSWTIPADYLEQVERWEIRALRDRPVTIETLSAQPLGRLVSADAATWIDRDLGATDPVAARDSGFGAEMEQARNQRRQWLLSRDLATADDGKFALRPDALATLQRREVQAAATAISKQVSLPFAPAEAGDRVEGIYRRRIDLMSGRFALIERSHDFTLVPWRDALDRFENRHVGGLVREGGVNWTIGRGRSGPAI